MERQKQIVKLVNVLNRTARSLTDDASPDVVKQAVGQYNRVLAALSKLDEEAGDLFVAIDESASAEVVASSCRQLAAFYRDEVGSIETPFDSDAFREFWKKSAQDLEDVGDFIRDSLSKMQEKKKSHETHQNGESEN